jgi:apolipoprotein N-acyltransferase
VLLPLLLALPAFYLHQQIAYGSPLGEYLSYGLRAYLSAFALWWAAWAIGVSLWAALLRSLIELGSGLSARLRPARATALRLALELAGLGLLYLGLPAWLLLRIAGA